MIGCIRSGSRRSPLVPIRGLLLSSVNVWVLFERSDDEERRIVGWRMGEMTDFKWRDRGRVSLEDLSLATFVGDLRMREDGPMAATVLDRQDPDDVSFNRIFARDYGRSTRSIRFDQLVATDRPSEYFTHAHASDEVTVVERAVNNLGASSGQIEFWPRDEENVPFVEVEWKSWDRPGRPRTKDDIVSPPNSNMDAVSFNTSYQQTISSAAGVWGFLPVVDGVEEFAGFHDGRSFSVIDFDPDLPAPSSGTVIHSKGLRHCRPLCVLDDSTVRVECMIERQLSAPIYPNGNPDLPASELDRRVYFLDRFVFDLDVSTGGVESSRLIAIERGEAYRFSGSEQYPMQSARYSRTGEVLTAAWVVDGERRHFSVQANANTSPVLMVTSVVVLDDRERYSLVRYGPTWYLFDDANGYREIDQEPFGQWRVHSGQTSVRNELKVSRPFYKEFMEA